jgi:outer membrane protein OmpA-like peptidoglycan-associated protein
MNGGKRVSRTTTVALAIGAACAAALPAHAVEQKASRQENIGVASGLAIGALAGGPIGAIVGAAAGAWLGDRYHRQEAVNDGLAADLAQGDIERARLRSSLFEARTRSDQLAHRLEQRTDLETQVSFRTGESALPAGAFERLKKLGSLVSTMPEMRVRVSGYADPRGTEDENSALSQQRADAVAAVFANEGLSGSRLVIEAHGESEATTVEGDLDGYALDRRVVVRIEKVGDEAVASN